MKRSETIHFVAILIVVCLTFSSCKDDSTSANGALIEITNVTSNVIELNSCEIDQGDLATEFLFDMEVEASPDLDIDGVEFDLTWSNGDESPNIFTNEFTTGENLVSFDWCFRYGTTEWFELDLKILAENEEVESNEYKIRVNQPNGANKLWD